jgi:hypothetical protein
VRTTFIVGTTSYFNVVEELEGFQAVHKGTSIAYFSAYGSKVSRVSCSKHVYRRSVAYGALERAIQCFVELADRTVCSLPGRHAEENPQPVPPSGHWVDWEQVQCEKGTAFIVCQSQNA